MNLSKKEKKKQKGMEEQLRNPVGHLIQWMVGLD